MNRADNIAAGQRQRRALVSVLPAARAGGAELSAVEQQLVEDFRQMCASSQNVMVRFFDKQASRDRESRIAATKPKFQMLKGSAA
jgi:hypothetical protein